MLIKPSYAIIHHSLTKDSGTVSWSAIRRYHAHTNGWRDIGYHYGVELINEYYEVITGRSEGEKGAHCVGMNGQSIGICFIGNYDLGPPPDEMMAHAVRILEPVIYRLGIPIENIRPHSQYSKKTCPGTQFPMERFRMAIREGFWKA